MTKTLSQIEHEDSIEALEQEKAQLMNVWASEDGRTEIAERNARLVERNARFYGGSKDKSIALPSISQRAELLKAISDFSNQMGKEGPYEQDILDQYSHFYGLPQGLSKEKLISKILEGTNLTRRLE